MRLLRLLLALRREDGIGEGGWCRGISTIVVAGAFIVVVDVQVEPIVIIVVGHPEQQMRFCRSQSVLSCVFMVRWAVVYFSLWSVALM